VIGDRGLAEGVVEYRHRRDSENQTVELEALETFIGEAVGSKTNEH
jgi:hypothetical protein